MKLSTESNRTVKPTDAAAKGSTMMRCGVVVVALMLGLGCSGSGQTGNRDGGNLGDGGSALNSCPGTPLTQDGTLDVDVKSIHVSGAVTLNGAPLPTSGSSRGKISFREKYTGTQADFDLGATGPGHYDVNLGPGEYDVLFTGNSALCSNVANTMPCNSGVVKKAIKLTTAGALDLDLAAAVVQGKVTVNGAAIPAAYQKSGSLFFVASDGSVLDTGPIGIGVADYRLVLLKGTYGVTLIGPLSCSAPANPLPCISGSILTGASIVADGVLDLAILTVKVSGKALLNGQPVAAGNSGLGSVSFRLSGGGQALTASTKPGAGLSTYQLTLLRGTYDVLYLPLANDCTAGMTCIGGTIKSGVMLQSDGVLDTDIPGITVQGNVTINGQAVVAANESATLAFRNADNSAVTTINTGPKALGSYKLVLLPGTYAIDYDYLYVGANCGNVLGKGPCMSGSFKSGQMLSTSGTLDIDISSVTVTGRVTVKGAAIAPAALTRGNLTFQLGSGSLTATPDLNSYSIRLLPGSYTVGYSFVGAMCQATESIPCGTGTLKSAQSLIASGVLDVDIPLINVSGRVTLNGGPMPDITSTRGSLQFSSSTGFGVTPNFGSTGAVSYRMPLLPSAYKVVHHSDFTVCAAATGIVPCVSQVLSGCM